MAVKLILLLVIVIHHVLEGVEIEMILIAAAICCLHSIHHIVLGVGISQIILLHAA